LLRSLSTDREVPLDVVASAATSGTGERAAQHLLRVASGLESFVLGESEIAGQVRAAAAASRSVGAGGLELDRLMAAATSTSRRAHRHTALGATARSVAGAGVAAAAELSGGALTGRGVLVVGAGEVATTVVELATALGARVVVCNRTRRHADRFVAAGAAVVDLGDVRGRRAHCGCRRLCHLAGTRGIPSPGGSHGNHAQPASSDVPEYWAGTG
jgi:glutamyl-tRNA reductase